MRGRGRFLFGVLGVFLLVSATPAFAGPSNPLVGSWESIDPDGSHVHLEINATGGWNLRDDGATVCQNHGFGFVPATVSGIGEFGSEGDTFDASGGDIYCYPRDGRGRQLLFESDGVGYAYWPDDGVMVDNYGVCWWRSGTGDPSNCPAE